MKTIGILSQSPEGAGLCFTAMCEYAQTRMGPLMHPDIVLATATLGVCLPAYTTGTLDFAVPYLRKAVDRLVAAGADFFVCAANTPHGVLELMAADLPIPCLHIADAVSAVIAANGWHRAGLLGTRSTMTGTVYDAAFARFGIAKLVPDPAVHARFDEIVFQEVNQGQWLEGSRQDLINEIEHLKARGADCVIMGCTEFPILVPAERSPLPSLDSTRILAQAAVDLALDDKPMAVSGGWVVTSSRP